MSDLGQFGKVDGGKGSIWQKQWSQMLQPSKKRHKHWGRVQDFHRNFAEMTIP